MEPTETPQRRLHRGFLTAGAVVAMVLAGLGIAGAQTSDTTLPPPQAPAGQEGAARPKHPGQAHLAVAARAIGISEEEMRTALRSGQSIAQVAQSRNVDVQKVVDALVADAQAKLPDRMRALVNRTGDPRPGGAKHHGGRHGAKVHLDVAAHALGMPTVELRAALRSGQSIAQVAQSRKVDVQKVVDALVADAKARLAAKVAAGELTQAVADRRAAEVAERIGAMVNRTEPGRP